MPNRSESFRSGSVMRCAVCEGKFGLVRYYSWRTQFCSKSCLNRFRSRRDSDRNWVGWLEFGFNQLQENRVRAP
jgi:hypothetical protein